MADSTRSDKPVVYWWRENVPPMFFLEGRQHDRGWGDLMHRALMERATGFRHTEFFSTHSRMYFEAHAGRPLCGLMYKNPTREDFLDFSLATAIYPAHRIYFSDARHLKQFSQAMRRPDSISLDHLLRLMDAKTQTGAADPLTIGIVEGRSYGKVIDKFIQRNQSKFVFRSGGNSNISVFRMFFAGRLDAIIDFPWRFHYYQNNLPSKTRPISSLNIAETEDYEAGYVACSQTPSGKIIIEHVNRDIHTIRAEFANLLATWLPKDYRDRYMKDSADYFKALNNSK